jgi:hypothetical protein
MSCKKIEVGLGFVDKGIYDMGAAHLRDVDSVHFRKYDLWIAGLTLQNL